MISINNNLTASTQNAASTSISDNQESNKLNKLGSHSVKVADTEKTQELPRLNQSFLTRIRDSLSITSLKDRLVRIGEFFQRLLCCRSHVNTPSESIRKEVPVTLDQSFLSENLEKYNARSQELISDRDDQYRILEQHLACYDLNKIDTSFNQILDSKKPHLCRTFIADANRCHYTINNEIIPKHQEQDKDKVKAHITHIFNTLKLDIPTQELISDIAHQGIFFDAQSALINNGIFFGSSESQSTFNIKIDDEVIQLDCFNSQSISKTNMDEDQQAPNLGSVSNWLMSQGIKDTQKLNSATLQYSQQINIKRDINTAKVTGIEYGIQNPVVELSFNMN